MAKYRVSYTVSGYIDYDFNTDTRQEALNKAEELVNRASSGDIQEAEYELYCISTEDSDYYEWEIDDLLDEEANKDEGEVHSL